MPGPRATLAIAAVCLALGLSITAHNRYIEASGTSVEVSFREPSTHDIRFRPHWSSLHFVSLILTVPEGVALPAALDSQGFPRENLDLQWEMRSGSEVVTGGRTSDSRLRIARGDDRMLVLGAFRAASREHYTLHVEIDEANAALDALSPRVEVGQRPGRPLLAYSLTGHGMLLVGAIFLFGFTRRKEKSWPYLQILEWSRGRRSQGRA